MATALHTTPYLNYSSSLRAGLSTLIYIVHTQIDTDRHRQMTYTKYRSSNRYTTVHSPNLYKGLHMLQVNQTNTGGKIRSAIACLIISRLLTQALY